MRADVETKDSPLEIKIVGSEADPGILEGYCATFDGPDRAGEIILKGAFASTLPDFKTLGFLCDSHDYSKEIGTIEDAFEDDRGLFVRARFFSTGDAQIVRQKLREKLERGSRPGMSIGYRVLDDEVKAGVRQLKSIELLEASVVSVPCNTRAHVAGVKSLGEPLPDYAVKARRLYFDYVLRRALACAQRSR